MRKLLLFSLFLIHWTTTEPFKCPDPGVYLFACAIPAVMNPTMKVDHWQSFETREAALNFLNTQKIAPDDFKGLYVPVEIPVKTVPDGMTKELKTVVVEVEKRKFVIDDEKIFKDMLK